MMNTSKVSYVEDAESQFKLLKSAMESTGQSAIDAAKSIGITNEAVLHCAQNSKGAKLEQDMLNTSIKATGATAKIAAVGVGLLNTVLNMFLTYAITFVASKFIEWLDGVIHATEKYRESLTNIKSELSDIESELKMLDSELKTNQERMEELENLGVLTFTEQEEYDNLVKQNNELQRTIDLLKLEQQLKQDNKNQTFVSTMQSDTQGSFEYAKDEFGNVFKGNAALYSLSGVSYSLATEEEYVNQQFEKRSKLLDEKSHAQTIEEKKRIQEQIDQINSYLQSKSEEWMSNADGVEYIDEPETEDDIKVNQWLDYINDFQDRMAIAMGSDNAKTNAFNRIIDNWQFDGVLQKLQDLGKTGEVTADMLNNPDYNEFINKLVEIGFIDTADNLDTIAKAFNKVEESAENATSVISQSLSNVEIFSGIQSLSEGLDQLDKIYADVLDKEDFDYSSILNNDSFKEAFSGVGDEYKDFIETISNSPNDINACQSAFNNLANAYINNSGALDNLTEDTKDSAVAMLEQMGIANALEIVEARLAGAVYNLADAERIASNYGLTLSSITVEEINNLITEGIISEQVGQSLALFALKKQLVNDARIETKEEVEKIYSLAKAAGIGTEALAKFEQFKNDLVNTTDARTRSYIMLSINKYKEQLFKEIENAEVEFTMPEIKYTGGSTTKSELKQQVKDLTQEYENLLDAFLEHLKAQLDAGYITLEKYLSDAKNKVQEFYNKGLISAEKYWSSLEAIYTNQKEVYDKVLSAVERRYDKEIEKVNELIEGLEEQNEALEKQLEEYDSALSVVAEVYDKQIEAIEKQQEAIQDNIDKLQEENDEKKLAMELDKARYNLLRSQQQRTRRIYKDGQFVYAHDEKEIKANKQTLEDLELDSVIRQLEKEKEALNEEIEKLNEFKDKWAEVSDAYQNEINKQIAISIWGKNYEEVILSNRLSDIEAFKDKYVSVQKQIENNDTLIESYNEKIEYYEKLKQQWSEISSVYEQSIEDQLAAQVLGADWEKQILEGRIGTLNTFKDNYIANQKAMADAAVHAANAQVQAYQAAADAAVASANKQVQANNNIHAGSYTESSTVGSVVDGYDYKKAVTDLENQTVNNNGLLKQDLIAQKKKESSNGSTNSNSSNKFTAVTTTGSSSGKGSGSTFLNNIASGVASVGVAIGSAIASAGNTIKNWLKGYSTGTKNAEPGVHSVAEGNKAEIIQDNHGHALLVEDETLYNFKGGETVYNNAETKKILGNYKKIKPLYTKIDLPENYQKLSQAFTVPSVNMSNMIQKPTMPSLANTSNGQTISINIGDINLHEVQDVNSLSKAIAQRLPNTVIQAINRR